VWYLVKHRSNFAFYKRRVSLAAKHTGIRVLTKSGISSMRDKLPPADGHIKSVQNSTKKFGSPKNRYQIFVARCAQNGHEIASREVICPSVRIFHLRNYLKDFYEIWYRGSIPKFDEKFNYGSYRFNIISILHKSGMELYPFPYGTASHARNRYHYDL
jgi:hypothetical protein